ncbi:MAG TPA: S8 family serine peptidase [Gemmatimonadales bacterium]|nr:S8 family serine peptidase [Gemmatimonadales bacterium]
MTALLLAACASHPAIQPNIDPGPLPPASITSPRDQLPAQPSFSEDPETAFRQGKMPLFSTGIPEFLRAHPTYDGRGVLIAILDSGIDPGVRGLDSTTTGERKIVDLRDFSGEGRIALSRVTPQGDSVRIGGVMVGGFGRVVLFNASGPWYGGLFRETPLGPSGGADVDGNGQVGDSLPVLVTRASDGWILIVDRDRDGSLAGERPVHDYLTGREMFGWALKRRVPRLDLVANIGEVSGEPVLDLLFDTSGHGTHVAGIAAGHDIYGVPGFNGVAPGAQVLGLKIANDAQGGLSTTGSMIKALDYAIRFAADRQLPLVANLSFGVGNEIEGTALIDRMLDSVLTLHPELVVAISAGNDGPGLSTLSFPGSVRRALTVGAILPGDPREPAATRGEPVAYFSARGGELAKPDIMTPGTAYSTVPLWNRGSETSSGTSMAAPHAAGLAALLVSAMKQENLGLSAWNIRQALMVTARPIADVSFLDQGAGIPDVSSAYHWLLGRHRVADIEVKVIGDSAGVTAAYRPGGLRSSSDTIQRFELLRPEGSPVETFTLRSTASWLVAPAAVSLSEARSTVTLRYRPEALPANTIATAVVTGWPADTLAGPAFRLVNTVGHRPVATSSFAEARPTVIPPGAQRRLLVSADSGRPFQVAARIGGNQPILVFVHEPGGRPLRGAEPQIAGVGQEEVMFRLDGRDVLGGLYEVVAVAPPSQSSSARFEVKGATIAFDATRASNGVVARIRQPEPAGTPAAQVSLVGAERDLVVNGSGSDTVSASFNIPPWASHLEVDFSMSPAQWSLFTDMGMTLFDSAGHQVDHAPLDYSFGRLAVDFDAGRQDQAVVLRLFPGLAEPATNARWSGVLRIRLYAGNQVALTSGSAAGSSVPAEEETILFNMIPSPWPLGPDFYPLGLMAVEQDGVTWTREVPLPDPSSPLMR